MSSNESRREGRDVAIPTPRKPVLSRDGSFTILPNFHNKGSESNNIASDEHLPAPFSAATYNNSPINPPSFSRSAVIPNYPYGSKYHDHPYAHAREHEAKEIPPELNSTRTILQSFNSSFSKPSTFSKPSRPDDLFNIKRSSFSNESTNVIEKDENTRGFAIQSRSPQSAQYSTFSIGSSSIYCQEQDDEIVSLGTLFRRQGNQFSCQSNSATGGGIRVSPFEPIVCDRNLPRQGRISPLPMPEYEAWCAKRRVRETTTGGQSDFSTHHPLPLREDTIADVTLGKNLSAEEDMESSYTAQFRPVSITPSDQESARIDAQYGCSTQCQNESHS